MHYSDGAFWRPLFEQDIAMLQVATGCSHNRCKFCDMYKQRFAPSSLAEIEQDIDELAAQWRVPKRLFLTGGNAFHLETDLLLAVLERVSAKLPQVESVGCFARIEDIALKSDDEISSLLDAGMDLVSIGAESGDDQALARMRKGHTASDIVTQCSRLDAIGMSYAFFYLAGIAGRGRGIEHARTTASVFSQVDPSIIMIHTMSVFEGTPLSREVAAGKFEPAPEIEVMEELREFYALYPKHTFMLANHYANTVTFSGFVPEQRQQILELMDRHIANADEEALEAFRSSVKSI